jgi:hypothetical protein
MEEMFMDEMFTKKVRTAAVAGWWTLLIAYCLLLASWFDYLLIMRSQPEGLLCFFGKGATWAEIRTIWLWGMLAAKIVFVMMLFIIIWLTIWAKKLAK